MPAPSLGHLAWQPALDRPDLLAPPVADALRLDTAGWAQDCYVAPIEEDLADTAAFCAAYAVPLEVSANCVVVTGRRGETTTTAACLVLATDRADVNRTVRRRLGVRKISFAAMDDAVAQTGMAYGGITPVGLPAGWPLLVDEAVTLQPWVVIGSGLRGSKLLLPGRSTGELHAAEVDVIRQVSAAG